MAGTPRDFRCLLGVDRTADYGALQDAASGRVDLAPIERRWEGIPADRRLHPLGTVRTCDVIRMLSSDAPRLEGERLVRQRPIDHLLCGHLFLVDQVDHRRMKHILFQPLNEREMLFLAASFTIDDPLHQFDQLFPRHAHEALLP